MTKTNVLLSLLILIGAALLLLSTFSYSYAQTGARPTATSVAPANITLSRGASTLIINGTNFKRGATVNYTGPSSGSVPASYIFARMMSFSFTPTNTGTYTFTVKNPDGLESSTSARLTVKAPITRRTTATARTSRVTGTMGTTGETGTRTGSGGTSVTNTNDSSISYTYTGPWPKECFGRKVMPQSDTRVLLDERGTPHTIGENFLYDTTIQPNVIRIVKFKTAAAGGYHVNVYAGSDGRTLSGFISPTPCDYEWAIKNGFAMPGAPDSFGWGREVAGTVYKEMFPVLDTNQADAFFKKTVYDGVSTIGEYYRKLGGKRLYLKPNSTYFLHVINASLGATTVYGTDGFPVQTTAQLTVAPETCNEKLLEQGGRASGQYRAYLDQGDGRNCYALWMSDGNVAYSPIKVGYNRSNTNKIFGLPESKNFPDSERLCMIYEAGGKEIGACNAYDKNKTKAACCPNGTITSCEIKSQVVTGVGSDSVVSYSGTGCAN